MKTILGTCHFPSRSHACFYYSFQHPFYSTREINSLVWSKIESGEIKIGKPTIKENQELKLIDNRYHICE